MKHLKFILFCLFFVSLGSYAQSIKVQGKVSSAEDGQELMGVSISVKGTGIGTVTDIDGRYSLDVEPYAILKFSYIGHETIEEKVMNRTVIDITMAPLVTVYDEVIVMGYSSQKKSELSSAVVTLSAANLTDVTTSDLGNMLQGKVAGMLVYNSTGQPGANAEIRIRGTGSITADVEPLYVVDGIPVGHSNPVNPNDIETLTVMKDAGATALFGSDAAGGVIVITTKSAKLNQQTQIEVKTTVGQKKPLFGNLVFMDSEELYYMHKQLYSPALFSSLRPSSLLSKDFDWQDAFFKPGGVQDYYVSASGSNNKTRYYASIDYYDEDGTLINTKYDCFSGRLNLNTQLYQWLDMNIRLSVNKSNNQEASDWTTLNDAHKKMPWDVPYDQNGELVKISSSNRPDGGTWYSQETWNSLHSEQYNYAKSQNFDFNTVIQLNVNVTDWLMFTTTNSISQSSWKWAKYIDPRTYNPSYSNGYLNNSSGIGKSFGTTDLLKATKILGAHSVNGLLGWEYGKYTTENMYASGVGMPVGKDVLSACSPLENGGTIVEGASWSAFVQAQYSYLSKYFVTASYRADSRSVFGTESRIGYFPSGAASWLISNEDFLSQNPVISFLKLRGSWGVTGNSNIRPFQYMSTYRVGALYQNSVGAVPERSAYPQLSWESAYMTGVGLDVNLWKRIELNVDLYNIENKDLLLAQPLAPSTGFFEMTKNIGSVRNRGLEIQLNTTNIKTHDFVWEMNTNIALNRNEVTAIPGDEPFLQTRSENISQQVKRGQDIYSWYMPKWLGVDPNNGDPLWEKISYDSDGNIADRGETNNFNEATPQVVGKATPKFSGGWLNTFSYRGFQLSINTNFVYGNMIYNRNRQFNDADGAYVGNNQLSMDNNKLGWTRWEAPGDEATHPKLVLLGNKQSNSISSRYLEDGSFFRIRNVTLGYNLPSKLLDKVNVRRCKIYVTGDNLFTFTKFSGMDPEVSQTTSEYSLAGLYNDHYPVSRQILIGLELGF